MLRSETAPAFGIANDIAPTGRDPPIIDAKAETIEETNRPPLNATTSAQPHFGALRSSLDRFKRRFSLGLQDLMPPAAVCTPDIVPEGGKFIEAAYSNPAGSRAYITSSTSRAAITGRRSL